MKQLLTLTLLLPLFASAQYTVSDTIQKPAYNQAKLFIAKAFRNANAVTQLDDPQTGTLLVKGVFKLFEVKPKSIYGGKSYGNVNFTLQINTTGNRYTAIIDDIRHFTSSSDYMCSGGDLKQEKPDCLSRYLTLKQWQQIKIMAEVKAKALLADLQRNLQE